MKGKSSVGGVVGVMPVGDYRLWHTIREGPDLYGTPEQSGGVKVMKCTRDTCLRAITKGEDDTLLPH